MSKPPTPDRPEDLDDPTGIRALLAALPDPGPMPAHLVDRINASITAEQEARAGSSVVSLDERRRPWRRIGLAAAAAAVAAVAVPALLTGTGPGGMLASLSGAHQGSAARSASSRALESSTQSPAPSTADGSAGHPATVGAGTPSAAGKDARMAAPGGGVTVYASNAAYTTAGFAEQLRGFVDHPGHPMQPLAAESPSIGPAGTPIGLQPCVQSLHLDSSARVMADLATFDGAAAVVLVVSTDTGQTGWAMPRTCTTGHTNPFAGPVALPE